VDKVTGYSGGEDWKTVEKLSKPASQYYRKVKSTTKFRLCVIYLIAYLRRGFPKEETLYERPFSQFRDSEQSKRKRVQLSQC
jgi:hypothetical protein